MSQVADEKTIALYASQAQTYAQRDKSARTEGVLAPFMAAMPAGAVVLDAACGAGWASEIMLARGFDVHALDACQEFADITQAKLKRPVRVMSFEQIDDVAIFDGIWASGALLHVRKADLPDILIKLARALKPGGLLLATFKEGTTEERDKLGRFFAYYTLEELKGLIDATPGLTWEGHIDSGGVDFAGKSNIVYGIKARA